MVVGQHGIGLDVRCGRKMDRVERPQPRRREPSCVSKNEVADAKEKARVEESQSLGVDAVVRIRKTYCARYFDERNPTRREDVTFRT
jgi:hypothetical protein